VALIYTEAADSLVVVSTVLAVVSAVSALSLTLAVTCANVNAVLVIHDGAAFLSYIKPPSRHAL
jgi:hypothetical protein